MAGKGNTTAPSRLYLPDRFTNLAVLQERSWTPGVTYIVPWQSAGTWTLSSNGMVFDSFKFQDVPGDKLIRHAGNANNNGVFGDAMRGRPIGESCDDSRLLAAGRAVGELTFVCASGPLPW